MELNKYNNFLIKIKLNEILINGLLNYFFEFYKYKYINNSLDLIV
jgi:hypothetical protein